MVTPNESLSTSILAIMYFGDVVFVVSSALTAAGSWNELMDVITSKGKSLKKGS